MNTNITNRKTGISLPVLATLALFAMPAMDNARATTFRIEIDYMFNVEPGDIHTHMPEPAVVNAVVQMFACHGHTLIIDVSTVLPHHDVLVRNPSNANDFFNYAAVENSFGKIKADNFNHAGEGGWHYCIFAHQYQGTNYMTSGSSGLGETPGDDFIVSLGAFTGQIGTPFDRAATLAHEFGHNLGLKHCIAYPNCDDSSQSGWIGPYQPNQPSIMSYFYQLTGVRTNLECQGLVPDNLFYLFKELDYSNGRTCLLAEDNLNENTGIGMGGVDWDCNGDVSGTVSHDLNGSSNGWCSASSGLQALFDGDEWSLIFDPVVSMSAKQLRHMPVSECVTAEEVAMFRGGCAQPTLTTEGCVGGQAVFLNAGTFATPNGRCLFPYKTVTAGSAAAPNNSALFLSPGTYSEPADVTLNRPMLLYSIGGPSTIQAP